MRNLLLIAGALVLVFTIGCSDGDDTNPLLPDQEEYNPDPPDAEGNLVIKNNSDQVLVLYARSERTKIISAANDDYLVNIPNPSGNTADLWLFKLDDVRDDIDNPDLADVYKRWSVILSTDNEIEHRVTWFVQGDNAETYSGTLVLNYVGGVEESVDVMLNNRTGAKLTSLRPGQQEMKVGLDYGNYTVLYRYWYSDQNSSDGEVERGWLETEIVNGQEVPIFLILNDSRNSRHIQVPHWNNGNVPETQYGNIRIQNSTPQPIQIWVGSDLIEDVMYTDQPVQNRSTIAANDIDVFTLEAIDTEYTFIAKYLTSGVEVARTDLLILEDQEINWQVTP